MSSATMSTILGAEAANIALLAVAHKNAASIAQTSERRVDSLPPWNSTV
jgi:hypothetical protein